jgi:uncharacterized membrane protein YidH (DUF202 family)
VSRGEAGRQLADPGLQPERTALAWRRTGLALCAGSVAAVRILSELLGPWAAVLAGVGVVWSLAILVLAHRRHHAVRFRLGATGGEARAMPGGLLPFATTVVVAAGGIAALLVTIRIAFG